MSVFFNVDYIALFVLQPKPIDVQVVTHHMQRYAVWFGGSMLASTVSTDVISTFFAHALDTGREPDEALLFSAAGILPSVPHQERLRGDRAEHLPPQPCIRSHVLERGGRGAHSGGGWGQPEDASHTSHSCGRPTSLRTDALMDLFYSDGATGGTNQPPQTVVTSSPIPGNEVTTPQGSSHKMFTASRFIIVDKIFNFCVPRTCTYTILTELWYVINQHESCMNALLCVYGVGFLLYVKCPDESILRGPFQKAGLQAYIMELHRIDLKINKLTYWPFLFIILQRLEEIYIWLEVFEIICLDPSFIVNVFK